MTRARLDPSLFEQDPERRTRHKDFRRNEKSKHVACLNRRLLVSLSGGWPLVICDS